jgi:hypothetical protein
MHQLIDAVVALYNPDKPNRPVNSPKAVYQISPEALKLAQRFGTANWNKSLKNFLKANTSLA